jgi:acyl transferase domain-containing protein
LLILKLQPVVGPEKASEQMAIIGVGCRFAGGVKDMASFWELISNGVDAVTLIPPERWDWEKYLINLTKI